MRKRATQQTNGNECSFDCEHSKKAHITSKLKLPSARCDERFYAVHSLKKGN